jgi:hypothetical protein
LNRKSSHQYFDSPPAGARPIVVHIESADTLGKSHTERSCLEVRERHYISRPISPVCLISSIDDEESCDAPLSSQTSDSLILRKKSGDIIKPSLKRDRANSLPSKLICPKEVHFDDKLERVRFFFHSEKPTAISNDASPTDEYPLATCFPFTDHEEKEQIVVSCFSASPVQLESAHFSPEADLIVGQVLVRNIAYQKDVVVRFTFDNWQGISEIHAFYDPQKNDGMNPKIDGFDRFTFNIKVPEFIELNSESQSIAFCVRYNVGNQEFWDNNSCKNYQLDFHRRLREAPHLRRTMSCPPVFGKETFPQILDTESFPQSLHGFFDTFQDCMDVEDAELWAGSFRKHAMRH